MSDLSAEKNKPFLDWSLEAKRILRAEIERRGVTYKRLARLMQAAGFPSSTVTVASS